MVPLSDHVPDLAALEMLLAVARTGSLNAASRQLGITQQAVSARELAVVVRPDHPCDRPLSRARLVH